MVETDNLKYDIEALSAERDALTKEVEALEAKRDDLFEGIRDAEQMKRVINNIISNSVKYLDKKKGIINIRIKDDGDFIQVEI